MKSMTGCFDLVGAGICIEHLPYLSYKTGTRLNEDFATVEEFWEDCKQDARTQLQEELKLRLGKKFKTNKVLRRDKIGYKTNEDVSALDCTVGYLIEFNRTGYFNYVITDIDIPYSTTITAYADCECVLRYNYDPCKKEPLVISGLKDCNELFIGFNHCEDSVEYSLSKKDNCCMVCENYKVKSVMKCDESCEYLDFAPLFGFTGALKCSFDNYLCELADQVSGALKWLTGMTLWQRIQMSDRYNKDVCKFQDEDIFEYYENEFNRHLALICDNFSPPVDDCFECNSAISYGFR